MIEAINLHNGKIIYNSFGIQLNVSLDEQIYELSEDLLQIEYGEHYFIDMGWYPLLNPKGYFLIRIIKNEDWLNPVFIKKVKAKDVRTLPQVLEQTAQMARALCDSLETKKL